MYQYSQKLLFETDISAAGLSKYVWPFSGQQALKGQISLSQHIT